MIIQTKLFLFFFVSILVVLGYVTLYYSYHILFNESYGRYKRISSHVELYPLKIHSDLNLSCLNALTNSYMYVALHELGHYIWFNINKSLKKEYDLIFNTSNYLTNYSKINKEEHFAEYFSMYMQDKEWFLTNNLITNLEKDFFKKIKEIKKE